MRSFSRLAIALAVIVGLADRAHSQTITTLFTGGNNGASLWTVYYDVNVTNPTGLNITGFDINTNSAVGTPFTVDFYATALGGTYVGNDANPAAWTLLESSNPGTAATANTPSHVDFTTPIFFTAGTRGFALRYIGVAPVYTNGNGSNQFFSNADLALTLGAARSTTTGPFTGGTFFSPRVWNGTIYYSAVPEPATWLTVGLVSACGLVVRRMRRTKAAVAD
jgi:hypothetical protein